MGEVMIKIKNGQIESKVDSGMNQTILNRLLEEIKEKINNKNGVEARNKRLQEKREISQIQQQAKKAINESIKTNNKSKTITLKGKPKLFKQ